MSVVARKTEDSNPYNIDSPVTWMPWDTDQDQKLLAFTQNVLTLRSKHPVFRRRRFFEDGSGVAFYAPDGTELPDSALDVAGVFAVAMFLDGRAIPYPDADGDRVTDSSRSCSC